MDRIGVRVFSPLVHWVEIHTQIYTQLTEAQEKQIRGNIYYGRILLALLAVGTILLSRYFAPFVFPCSFLIIGAGTYLTKQYNKLYCVVHPAFLLAIMVGCIGLALTYFYVLVAMLLLK